MYCIKGNTCDIVGTFQRPHSDSKPGDAFPQIYAPDSEIGKITECF